MLKDALFGWTRKGDTRRGAFSRVGWFSRALAFPSLYYPWEKVGTTRSLQNNWCFCKTHELKNGQAKALEWGWKQSVGLGRNKKTNNNCSRTSGEDLTYVPGKNWFSAWIIIHVFRKQNRLFAVKRWPYFLEYAPRRLFRFPLKWKERHLLEGECLIERGRGRLIKFSFQWTETLFWLNV